MTVFGDYDPDDAWDASDPVPEMLLHIARRIAWVTVLRHRITNDDIDARIQRIVDDVALIRDRVLNGDL